MNIDKSIVERYLRGETDLEEHWVFRSISGTGEVLFSQPDLRRRREAADLCQAVLLQLQAFVPCNEALVRRIFPRWDAVTEELEVLLCAGCPEPYDAFVREHHGRSYMMFDLIRLLRYQDHGMDVPGLLRGLITHEAVHACLRAEYPEAGASYADKLRYITFDEGFAHLLSFSPDIFRCDFADLIRKHYAPSVQRLGKALRETDSKRQQAYLEAANSGPYWDKFASVSGLLYLAQRKGELASIYRDGPDSMARKLLELL